MSLDSFLSAHSVHAALDGADAVNQLGMLKCCCLRYVSIMHAHLPLNVPPCIDTTTSTKQQSVMLSSEIGNTTVHLQRHALGGGMRPLRTLHTHGFHTPCLASHAIRLCAMGLMMAEQATYIYGPCVRPLCSGL
jgi:hypothetical protein